jgi:hypothetical protein
MKMSRLGLAVRKAMRAVTFGHGHVSHELVKTMKSYRPAYAATVEKARLVSPPPGPILQARAQKELDRLDGRIGNKENYIRRREAEHQDVKGVASALGGLGAAGAITLGGTKLINKLEEPVDITGEYKLAAEGWVRGFCEKAAEFGVDGPEWLDGMVRQAEAELAQHGMIKTAFLGKLLGMLTGAGALGGAAYAFNRTRRNDYAAAQAEAEKDKALAAKQRTELDRPAWGGLGGFDPWHPNPEANRTQYNTLMDFSNMVRTPGYRPGQSMQAAPVAQPMAGGAK